MTLYKRKDDGDRKQMTKLTSWICMTNNRLQKHIENLENYTNFRYGNIPVGATEMSVFVKTNQIIQLLNMFFILG